MLWTQLNRTAAFLPAVDLAVSESDLVLTLDLPGLTAEDVSIEVQNNELTVRGERNARQLVDGASYVYAQRPVGAFEHRIRIPAGVDPGAVTASMENGVLSLIIPKPERIKPRKIEIGAPSEQRELETANA